MSVSVGEKVQIKDGGMDITNGAKARSGKFYGEGGPLFGEVVKVIENWNTSGKFGLPKTVTKVRIADAKGNIVWQVRPEDIASNKVTEEPPAQPPPDPPAPPETEPIPAIEPVQRIVEEVQTSNAPYAMESGSNYWDRGSVSVQEASYSNSARLSASDAAIRRRGGNPEVSGVSFVENNTPVASEVSPKELSISPKTIKVSQSNIAIRRKGGNPEVSGTTPPKNNLESYSGHSGEIASSEVDPMIVGATGIYANPVIKTEFESFESNPDNMDLLLNNKPELIQNSKGYPYKVYEPDGTISAKYDYSFIPGDNKYEDSSSLEDELMKFRMAAGIQVHGSQDIAKSVKMYMYNRFKVPDTNMAQSRMFTHIFFTRPDLYLLDLQNNPCEQVLNHTDTALLWRRYPELFKLLTDGWRCIDSNNFNMLLSNQVQSFSLHDEKIATKDAGHSWTKQVMTYGDSYTGRGADTFECTFMETNELSVINLIKLWMTYIDNVHTGAWSPNYNKGLCHVHDRALDYASSVYVFKCGVDGEEILYWTKYYGVFPITTGASVLSWENSENKVLSPTIEFAYSFKKDLSPISLLEFNDNAFVVGPQSYVSQFDPDINGTTRPYVGTPYIEIDLGTPNLEHNDISIGKKTQIRLKFKKDRVSRRSDERLFRVRNNDDEYEAVREKLSLLESLKRPTGLNFKPNRISINFDREG